MALTASNCLTETLSSTEVFERVRALGAQVPNAIACPGIRLAESSVDAPDFSIGMAYAIRQLVGVDLDDTMDSGVSYTELQQDRPDSVGLRENGTLAQEPERCDYSLPLAAEEWYDTIRTAIGSDPRDVMWQLCLPMQLAMLDVGGYLPTVPFAPRIMRQARSVVARTDTAWTTSGQLAGLLRLVPIRLAAVATSWTINDGQFSRDD